MTKIDVEIHDDIVSILTKIKDINDAGIELELPSDAIITENIVNLKLIKSYAERLNKVIHFSATDKKTERLLSMLDEQPEQDEAITSAPSKFKLKLPAFNMPSVNMNFKNKKLPLIIAGIAVLTGLYIYFGSKLPKANINIAVNSQSLSRSLAVKVATDKALSTADKIIPGLNLEALADATVEVPTTGEKQVGEQAKGIAKIYNKTNTEKTFKKNTKLYSGELVFKLNDDVTVPAMSPQIQNDPGSTLIPGEKEVDIKSEGVGDKYNIDSGETLKVEDEDSADFEAKTTTDLTGGSSKTVKIVVKADILKAQEDIKPILAENTKKKLQDKVASTQKLISGSETSTLVNESLSNKENEEADKLVLTQTVSVKGLVYSQKDLEKLMEELAKELVPQDFELSAHDNNLTVDILGNTENTKLSLTEADIQVTLKTAVVPHIDIDKLKNELAGKKQNEAAKILGSIRNINSYEINISPTLPFFRNVPKNTENIEITVKKA